MDLWATSQMHITRRRKRITIRNTWRNLWHTSRRKSLGRESISTRILLALSSKWQQRNSQVLSQLSNFCKQDKSSSNKLINNRTNLATRKMRNWHNRQIASSPRKLSICSCGCGIFHKMDWSQASNKHVILHNEEILMAEHHMPLQGSKTHHTG